MEAAEASTSAEARGLVERVRKNEESGSLAFIWRRTEKIKSVSPLSMALSKARLSSFMDSNSGTCFPARSSWLRSCVASDTLPSS